MLDPISRGVANPWASKALYDAASTARGRDDGVFDQDGDVRDIVCRSTKP
jgi:hypothetical protein